jgi:hypothetical protein
MYIALDIVGLRDSTIAKKTINQNGGPLVDPWLGPFNGVVADELYMVEEVP